MNNYLEVSCVCWSARSTRRLEAFQHIFIFKVLLFKVVVVLVVIDVSSSGRSTRMEFRLQLAVDPIRELE